MSKILRFNDRELVEIAERIRHKIETGDVAYAIGDDCDPRLNTGAPTYNHCYRNGARLCDLERVGAAALNIAAASPFVITVVPTNTQYFEPVAAETLVTNSANPNDNRRVRFTAFAIAASPQEPIDDRAPTAATTAFMWSDHFIPSDYGPRPVQWGIFSVAALTKPLLIYGWNPQPVACDIEWFIYGNARDHLPAGKKPGEKYVASGLITGTGRNPFSANG